MSFVLRRIVGSEHPSPSMFDDTAAWHGMAWPDRTRHLVANSTEFSSGHRANHDLQLGQPVGSSEYLHAAFTASFLHPVRPYSTTLPFESSRVPLSSRIVRFGPGPSGCLSMVDGRHPPGSRGRRVQVYRTCRHHRGFLPSLRPGSLLPSSIALLDRDCGSGKVGSRAAVRR